MISFQDVMSALQAQTPYTVGGGQWQDGMWQATETPLDGYYRMGDSGWARDSGNGFYEGYTPEADGVRLTQFSPDGREVGSHFLNSTQNWHDTLRGMITTLGGAALGANLIGPYAAGLGTTSPLTAGVDSALLSEVGGTGSFGATGAGTAATGALPGQALLEGATAGNFLDPMAMNGGMGMAAPVASDALGAGATGFGIGTTGLGGANTIGGALAAIGSGLGSNTNLPNMGQQQGGQQPGGQQQGNLTGNGNLDGILRLLSGLYGYQQQNSFADKLLQRAADATPNRAFYEDSLKRSYTDPASFLNAPDNSAIMDLTLNKLQRGDATRGNLANSTDRQRLMNQHAYNNLSNYRTGLAGIVGQQANTYTGNNGMFQAGAALDSSAGTNILNGILGMLGSRTGGSTNGVPNTIGTGLSNMFSNWVNNGSNWINRQQQFQQQNPGVDTSGMMFAQDMIPNSPYVG